MRLLPLLLVAALVAGCASRDEGAVVDLDAIEDLRAEFNEDAGRPRLVLLLSPS
jgi:hypothetical protein